MMKTSATKTKKQLIIENEEIRSRLFEMEETLKAIRSGEVDAIVVSGPKGEQVYSLSTSETPYRNFVEEMHEGALTLDNEGLILFCNKRFAKLVDEPADHVMGSYLKRFVTPDDTENFDNVLAQLSKSKKDILAVTLINSVSLKLSFRFMPPNFQGESYIVIASDITELKKKESELLELQRILKRQLEQLLDLRIDLINAKIEVNTENGKLKNTNKKLVKEICGLKLENEGLKQKFHLLNKIQ
jgi:PAS domain S-box-containing protein